MVADQRKKRANAASLVGCTSREQCKVNRKKLKVQKHGINMMPNISLEWDNKKKTVVSKRGQIGIARRHLISFLEPGSAGHSILADVCSVPQEIFELENLREVLTYEVWQSNLTDTERYFLSQFLPKVPEPDITIQDLLAGEDFQFGNPFVKWGSSLCYGELHPDNILHKEPSLKAVKKAYYLDLQKYHSCMIVNLEKWKEKWASCKDPEEEIVQNLWSSKRPEERNVLLLESRVNGNEENLVTTPESYSWNNSEVAYSSDNQNLGTVRGESKRGNGFLRKISDNSLSELKVVTSVSRKGEQVHKQNIQQSDGTKYMSYIKVSREQHERVKSSMNNASNCIHPRSLNNVLGTDALNVQPYERFVEEEKKKLHQHWLKLATSDIPEGFAYWVKRELQKQALARSLGEEIGHKMELQTTPDEEKKGSPNEQMDLSDDSEDEFLPPVTAEDVDEEQSGDLVQEQEDIYEHTHDVSKMTGDEDMPNQVFIEDNNQQQLIDNSPRRTMISSPSPGFYQQQNGSLNTGNHPQDDSLEIGLHGDKASSKTDEDASIASEYPVEDPLPSYGDIWPVGDVHGSYYHESMNARYVPAAQELSIGNHPQQFITEQEVKLLDDMEIDSRDKNGGGGGKDMPLFDSYANLNRNEIYHSLRDSVYHGQQKQSEGLGFQPGNNDVMVEAFPGQFRDQIIWDFNGGTTIVITSNSTISDASNLISKIRKLLTFIRIIKALKTHVLRLEKVFRKRLIGQDEAVSSVCRALRRSRVGLRDMDQPIASFMFVGPTGVGKTELAKMLAEEYFGSKEAMVRLDMSEYAESHVAARLVGSPPGYVGHDEGGQLTEAVRRRPHTVVLFDEIEKANSRAHDMLLQILDDGRLTDGKGRTADFRHAVVIFTSNIGGRVTGDHDEVREEVVAQLKKVFKPELLNRLDDIIVFKRLKKKDMREILEIMLLDFYRRVEKKRINVEVSNGLKEKLLSQGFNSSYGARPLRRAIARLLEDNLADRFLNGSVSEGQRVIMDVDSSGDVMVLN
ncbi:Chaperone protein ClpC1- chloroplastic [Striga hermonthica]|uniref:Chaperone protein ClpC1- chloroplastic n=1 Tax=Striga hermonthica TaxID=68872 RepID=A0A9N7MJU5_STRHE|nr:Chaperone protein ClpC1- chloroplastic [Striga hermonthica]